MFTVDYARGHAGMPCLKSDDYLVPLTTRAGLKARTILENEFNRLYLADNLGTVVEFGCIDKADGEWWSSREGCFNTGGVIVNGSRLFGPIAIIAVNCVNHTQHYHLDFVRRKIAECGQDIRFFRIEQFENREIYYVPYEPDNYDEVFAKLSVSPSVLDIEDIK